MVGGGLPTADKARPVSIRHPMDMKSRSDAHELPMMRVLQDETGITTARRRLIDPFKTGAL